METDKLINNLIIKNQIIYAPLESLIEEYSNKDSFKLFLEGVNNLLESEDTFFLISSYFIEKVMTIINYYRTQYQETTTTINNIIYNTNKLKNINETAKNIKLNHYIIYQEQTRHTKISTKKSLIESLGYDAIALINIFDNTPVAINNKKIFLQSINYLIETIPEIFQDEIIQTNTYHIINELSKEQKRWHFRRKNETNHTLKKLIKITIT